MSAELKAFTAEPLGQDIVELLEEALEQAKQGKLSSVAFAAVYRDGCTQQAWSAPPSFSLLLGTVSRLQYRLNQSMD